MNLISNKIVFIILLFLVVCSITSCHKITLDSETAIIDTDIYTSPILIQFQNANSASSVTTSDAEFPVTITGDGAQYVVASDGSNVFRASHGILCLALLQTAAPSTSHPVTFNIYAEIPNFAPVTQTITITDTSVTSMIVNAIEYNHPVLGTNVLATVSTINNGVSPGITLSTAPTGVMTESASIIIPAGTELRDESGKTISSNNLKSNIIQYGTGTQASLSAFPGGFNVTNVLDRTGQPVVNGGTFVTAGLLQVNMSGADGTPVKQFSNPIQMNVEINNGLTNPLTGLVVKLGDTIPIWSLNEKTGQWKYESTATVSTDANSKLSVGFSASHLSVWNLDFWFPNYAKSLTVRFHMPAGVTNTNLWPRLVTADGQYLAGLYTNTSWALGAPLTDGFSATLNPVPNLSSAKFVVLTNRSDVSSNIATTSPTLFNPATQGSIDVTIAAPTSSDYVNLKINIAGKCTNKNTSINVGTWVYFWPSTDWSQFQYCYVGTSGWSWNNPVKLMTGKKYVCATWYGGTWNSNVIEIQKQDYSFPSVVIDGALISGNAKYTTTNNTLTVNSTFNVFCR